MRETLYTPNDSPFGEAFKAYAKDGIISLQVLSVEWLDEFQQICGMILDTPAYAGDIRVSCFRDALAREYMLRFDIPQDN